MTTKEFPTAPDCICCIPHKAEQKHGHPVCFGNLEQESASASVWGGVRPNGSVSWQRVLQVRDCASFGCFHSVLRDQLHLKLFSTHPSANRNHPATLEFHLHIELQNLPVLPLELYILCQNLGRRRIRIVPPSLLYSALLFSPYTSASHCSHSYKHNVQVFLCVVLRLLVESVHRRTFGGCWRLMCSPRQAALNPSRVSACPPHPVWRSAFSSALSVSHHQHWAATSSSLSQPDRHVSLQPTVFMENQPEVMKAAPLLFSPSPSKRERLPLDRIFHPLSI